MTCAAGSIRESAEEIVRQASHAGMTGACRLLECTPKEIEAECSAFAAAQRQADMLAWLAGRYVLLAMHAPKRYPSAPNAFRRPPERMTDGQMADVFRNIAAHRRDD